MERAPRKPALAIVMPVYNEEASLRKVVFEWFDEVDAWVEDFVFLAINDGSSDRSQLFLEKLHSRLGDRLIVINKPNSGHGQSCLFGYREALRMGAEWIVQIDSDGQCDPQYFHRLWRLRKQADIVYGLRTRRDDGLRRIAASMVLRIFLLVFFRVWCADSNVPYRLMHWSFVAKYVNSVPPDFSLANVALAVLLSADPSCRHRHVPIRFRERYGGEPSVKMSLFGRKAFELRRQLREMLADAHPRRERPVCSTATS